MRVGAVILILGLVASAGVHEEADALLAKGKAKEALALLEKTPNDEPAVAAGTQYRIGKCYRALRRKDDAIAVFESSLALYEKAYPAKDHAATADCLNQLGEALQECARYEEAAAAHTEMEANRNIGKLLLRVGG